MKNRAHNTFNQGMVMDLTPLTTPNNVLTDCLNGTIITYAGNEFTLQNDMGNCKVDKAYLKPGFLPVGMTEYGGIIYIASYNPETKMCEVGSFPSPQRDFSTSDYNNIGAIQFTTPMYTVNTGSSVKENLKVVKKLFEPEIFTLHPGDMYLIDYEIDTPSSGNPSDPDYINTDVKLNNYITKDVSDRKLFRLKFYKISSSNNFVELDESKIEVVPKTSDQDLDSEYRYFTESSSAVLAAGLELEDMDVFNVSVVDTSLRTSSNKKVSIEAIGYSNSLADFQGVRLDVISPSSFIRYLDKGSNVTKKVSGIIDGLSANDDFQCIVTPYSKYSLFPSLQQNFKFTLGKYLTSATGVNNLFRYYVDPGYIKIDFDYTFQGNSASGPHLFIEFYDPWSDYSIIKRVDNPTFYGINSVIIETINEPLVDQFDETTIGGTPINSLITNTDTTYENTLLNSTGLIRTTQVLRLNTFYIVRISGADSDTSSGSLTYTHYDLYKGLYTTSMFNDIYVAQNGLSLTDPAYIADFNDLDFDISKIGYQSTVSQTSNINSTPIVVSTPSQLMTNGQFYMIDANKNTSFTNYLNTKTYATETDYSVTLKLEGIDQVFGNFKTNLVTIQLPILNSSSESGVTPTIKDQNYDGNTNVSPSSLADWSINLASGDTYNVTTKLTTSRNIYAPVAYDNSKQGVKYAEVSLINSFLYRPNGDSQFTNKYAGMKFIRNSDGNGGEMHFYDPSGNIQVAETHYAPFGQQMFPVFDTYSKKYSGVWAGFDDSSPGRWYGDNAPGDYGAFFGGSDFWRQNILFLMNPANGDMCACRTTDIQAAIDFFTTLKVASNVRKTLWLHYANGNAIQKNGQIITTAQFQNAPITTNFTPDSIDGVYQKTYLSTFRFRAMNSIQEFNPTVINEYISSRLGDSVIVDNKDNIRDGFIPFITNISSSIFDLSFNDIIIDQAPDASTLQNMQNAFTIGGQDSIFTSAGNYKAHGTLFSSIPEQYTNFLGKFSVGNVTDGIDINPDTVYIHLTNANEPNWYGWYGRGGKAKAQEAPHIYIDFQITKL